MTGHLLPLFDRCRRDGTTALLPFLTAGLPRLEASVTLFEAMAEAGADGFEVGIPYSDPLMDGPVIQEASARARAAGATLERSIEVIAEVAARTGKPVMAMTYANPVLRMGAGRFGQLLAAAGAEGLIVADLPLEEATEYKPELEESGVGMVLFVAPTTSDERVRRVAEARPLFIYGVADLGVTGVRRAGDGPASALAARIRDVTDSPLVMGVGISTPAQAAQVAPHADGVIVGSALVERVLEAADVATAARELGKATAALAAALH